MDRLAVPDACASSAANGLGGARCLDLFAGSGALGIEALSRGAAHCDFVERNREVAQALAGNLATLGAGERGRVIVCDANQHLRRAGTVYDIVFLDPPFTDQLLAPVCAALQAGPLLAPGALVYVEHGVRQAPQLPSQWLPRRQKRSGDVAYALFSIPGNPASD